MSSIVDVEFLKSKFSFILDPSKWSSAYLDADFLLSDKPAIYILPCYVVFVLLLKAFMDTRKERFNVKPLMAVHNLFLCLLSLAMVLGTLHAVFTGGVSWERHYCSTDGSVLKGNLWFWAWVFYASKYYELLDTPLLLLAKRPLTVLHVWHHSSIAVLCLYFMKTGYNFFWSGVAINAGIHTFMYYYYFRSACGSTPKWKQVMTTGQIVQFVWGISSFWAFPYACSDEDKTEGAWFTWKLNQFILISYLVLFGNFFIKTYKSGKGKKKGKKD